MSEYDYPATIQPLSEEDGGGYLVSFPNPLDLQFKNRRTNLPKIARPPKILVLCRGS